MLAVTGLVSAAPSYTTDGILVPPDQWELGGEPNRLTPAPVYKPHDSRTDYMPGWWITSNERTGCAGVTTFTKKNIPLKNVIIDEPGVEFHGGEEANAPPCVGSIYEPPGGEPPEGTPPTPDDQFPADVRFNPSVCLPVVLPPGQNHIHYSVENPDGSTSSGRVKEVEPGLVCAPLGTERHARHPHGITYDWNRHRAYQVIEHSGLRWNKDRTRFRVAETTDEESGMTLAWDISDRKNPTFLKAYLNGHAAHEITVNTNNGLVFQGNHEDSPGVYPPIWVDVIDTTKANPYGFIDTGYFNAIQGIDVDETNNIVWGTTHVGEKVFAFDGDCVPTPNTGNVVPPPAPPGYSLPPNDTGMESGWNCIKWWVDIRPAVVSALPDVAQILSQPFEPGGLAQVLHMHNLTADDVNHRSYSSIHSIHDAEHTGLSDEESSEEEEEETEEHYMARYVVEVDTPTQVNGNTKKANAPVHVIDLSNGYDILDYPNGDDVREAFGLVTLRKSFVHAHFLWVDPARHSLLVSGEHTGNVGVVDTNSRLLEDVIPITKPIANCTPPPPEPGESETEVEEPHVHGVYIQPVNGRAYITDEGEHCFYESVTTLIPKRGTY